MNGSKNLFVHSLRQRQRMRKSVAASNEAFDALALDAFCGIQIPKRLIPKSYITRYRIDNLWKYNFHKNWRLMYSVAGDGKNVIALILEWLPHKEYERRFGY